LRAGTTCFDGPLLGIGRGLRRRRSPTLKSIVSLLALAFLRTHSRGLGVWDTEEMLDATLRSSLVGNVGELDHGRFQIRTTMGDGEGPAPNSNQCDEEKSAKQHNHDFVTVKRIKAWKKPLERERSYARCAMREGRLFAAPHVYMCLSLLGVKASVPDVRNQCYDSGHFH